jgi:co-chaperonin GroES (HSP10)
MTIKVTGCRILVRPKTLEEHDEVRASAKAVGIALLEESERKEAINVDQGTVLQIGSKCHEDYIGDLEVGNVIGYAKFGGKFFPDPDNKGKHLLVINDEDVICIFKE